MSTSDRELLELAARAAGIKHSGSKGGDGLWVGHANILEGRLGRPRWNPLNDDGDALRLAVKLGLDISIRKAVQVSWFNSEGWLQWVEEPEAEVRRAIVRAAAEIGRGME